MKHSRLEVGDELYECDRFSGKKRSIGIIDKVTKTQAKIGSKYKLLAEYYTCAQPYVQPNSCRTVRYFLVTPEIRKELK